jgi:6 kDa early secretory antigenic target
MMTAGSEFTAVNFGGMAQGEADFASVYQALQNTLTTLESQLNSSLSQWTGSAQQAYYAAKAKWDAAAADMATVVNSLSQVIGVANANYTQTEAVNRAMWE